MIARRTFLQGFGFCVCLAYPARAESTWSLVTPTEALRDRSTPHEPDLKTRSSAPFSGPSIEMAQPNISGPVQNPLSIRVRFVAQHGTTINPASFKATYGWIGIDITKRLLEHATLNASGISADHADIPPGEHKVTLSIADNLGQSTSRAFKFTVLG